MDIYGFRRTRYWFLCLLVGGTIAVGLIWLFVLRSTPRPVRSIRGHSDGIGSLSFGPDGNEFVSTSHDGTAKFWDASTGIEQRSMVGLGPYVEAAYCPNKRIVATGNLHGVVKVWDSQSGLELRTLLDGACAINHLVFSTDGRFLGAACEDRTVRCWDVTTWTALPLLDNHGGAVPWLAFWPEGEKIATVDLGSKEVKVWNVITGELITTLVGFGGWINCVAISPDGKSLVAAGALDRSTGVSSGIVIWDLSTNSIVLKPHAKPGGIESIAYSHDGRFIAGGGSNNGNTFVWDAVTGEIRAILQSPHRGAVTAVTFALDDTLLVTGTANGQEPGEIDIWRPTWNTK